MSLKLAKNITRKSWDTILMPDTVISRVKKLSFNESSQFIFIDCRGIYGNYRVITLFDH